MAPLLWLVDFAVLWNALSETERVQAESAARRAGLDRYLHWARRRAMPGRTAPPMASTMR